MTDELSPQAEEAEAILRIAHSADGRLMHRYLRRVLETVFDVQEVGALNSQNGRRSLARDLMRLMADGIDDRRDDPGNTPILSARSASTSVARARRRDPRTFPRVDSFPDDDPNYSGEPAGGPEPS